MYDARGHYDVVEIRNATLAGIERFQYMFSVQQSVQNSGPGAIAIRPYGLVSRVGVSKDPSIWNMHTGPIGYFDGKTNYSNNYKDLDKAGAAGTRTTLH